MTLVMKEIHFSRADYLSDHARRTMNIYFTTLRGVEKVSRADTEWGGGVDKAASHLHQNSDLCHGK